ncbi:AAA family ATPase [Sphingomonas sp. AX6]|uniref:AAA family ATPase n=1 Tax=Sphingomonas sp. AX6 TaxID=2653171 RepID=UPI0012F3B5B7|nr:AAA family ATPase [Sphingomonas sp. AX6]VXC96390.1 DNA polymerase III subunit delta [Sphingomonas sp. AX6]
MTSLVGNASAHEAFYQAARSGSLHHCWLLSGPEGVGKASFAIEAAGRLLAAQEEGEGVLSAAAHPRGTAAQLFDKGNHPDFRILTRPLVDPDKPEKGIKRSIPIDDVRALIARFATRPSMGSRRVIVIDAIDDLERGAANALLKNLEEPPAGTIFLLVSHSPGRLLPTIRSRCRVLRFETVADGDVARLLREQLPDASADEIEALVRAGGGSPGRALSFAGLELATIERDLATIADTGDANNAVRNRLAKSLSTKDAQPRYEAFLERVPSFVAERARLSTGDALASALQVYETSRQVAASSIRLSLDAQASVFELGGVVARLAPTNLR